MKIKDFKALLKALKEAQNVCWECAQDNGATMPKGACNTFWEAECSICLKHKGCCAKTDWKWPKELELNYIWD